LRFNLRMINPAKEKSTLTIDPEKSVSNKAKHGIDFPEAQSLWKDLDLLEIPVKTSDEERFLVVGVIDGKH